MPAAAVNAHIDLTRKRAHRLCADAARPHVIRLSTLVSAAGMVFAGGVIAGYIARAWWLLY
jgi:hypothetical protein